MKRLFLIFIAGLMCLSPLDARAQKLPMKSESDRYLNLSHSLYNPIDQTAVGTIRISAGENFDDNQYFSKITAWCIYHNDALLPTKWDDGSKITIGYDSAYSGYFGYPAEVAYDPHWVNAGCSNTTATEKAPARPWERSNSLIAEIDTTQWLNGLNTFKIEAITSLGGRFSISTSVVVNNIKWTAPTTSTQAPRVDVWIDPPTITNLNAAWSDKVTKSQISTLIGNSSMIEVKYGVKGKGTFKTKKIQLAEGINYFPAESRAEFTLSGLSPKTFYNGSLQSSGPNGKSGLVTFSFKSTSTPPKTTSGSSSSSSSSDLSTRSVIGWRLDKALNALGLSIDYARESSSLCPNRTLLGIWDPSNWIVVMQIGKFLYACKP